MIDEALKGGADRVLRRLLPATIPIAEQCGDQRQKRERLVLRFGRFLKLDQLKTFFGDAR
jgi:hypothetical protein